MPPVVDVGVGLSASAAWPSVRWTDSTVITISSSETPFSLSCHARRASDRQMPQPAACLSTKQVRSVLCWNIGLSAHSQKQWSWSSVAGILRAIS